jgi:anaerobic ribonucleoside-triphosphate reductase
MILQFAKMLQSQASKSTMIYGIFAAKKQKNTYPIVIFDVTSGNFNSRKDHEEKYIAFCLKCIEILNITNMLVCNIPNDYMCTLSKFIILTLG